MFGKSNLEDFKINGYILETVAGFVQKENPTMGDIFDISRLINTWRREQETGIFIVTYTQTATVGEEQAPRCVTKKKGKVYTSTWKESDFKPILESIRTTDNFNSLDRDVKIFIWNRLLAVIVGGKIFAKDIDPKEYHNVFIVSIKNKIFDDSLSSDVNDKIEYLRKWSSNY